jgi:hypothetical protein
MPNRFAIGTLTQCQNLCDDAWDLFRTARPRVATPAAQAWTGSGSHIDKALTVATRVATPRQHPTVLTRYAVIVDKAHEDADITGLVQWFVDRPAALALLDDGDTITTTFPDGTTATRPNHFWAGSAGATVTRWNRLRRIVLPDAWSNATAYAVGDTCWRSISGTPVGFRAINANTNSQPTLANGNWDAYLGPLPASWTPVLP